MGLSIHYSGTIRQYEQIDALTEEVADICQDMGWQYSVLDGDNTDRLKGICFSPHECEPIFLTFLPTGKMCSPVNLMNREIYEQDGSNPELLYTTSTKTQFAGRDTHIAVIKLLHYLRKKFFASFELNDEGKYWETLDEEVLNKQFTRYEVVLDAFTDVLDEMKAIPGETAASLAARIEKLLKDRFKKDE